MEVTQGRCEGRVEHVASGRATYFGSLEELLTFMAQVLATVRAPPRRRRRRGDLPDYPSHQQTQRRKVMRSNREIFGFSMVLITACCLALVGFAIPASAKPIVVTTLTDTADPPFNVDGPCGTGTVSDLPGADGSVSLREA